MPNASGEFPSATLAGFSEVNTSGSGAFTATLGLARNYANAGYMNLTTVRVAMNLKNCNSIFGKATKVQPKALTLRFYIKF